MEKTLIWCCTNKADSRNVKSECFIHHGPSDTHTSEQVNIRTCRQPVFNLRGSNGIPVLRTSCNMGKITSCQNSWWAERMEGRLEKSSSGVTCHRRKAKHCFFNYSLFIKLHFGLFLISNLLLLLHFPLVLYFSFVSLSSITQYVKQWKIELCSTQGWKKPLDWLFSTAGAV